jgi:hypothetical protein
MLLTNALRASCGLYDSTLTTVVLFAVQAAAVCPWLRVTSRKGRFQRT